MKPIDINWNDKQYTVVYEVHEQTHPRYQGMDRDQIMKHINIDEDDVPQLKIINIISPLKDIPLDVVRGDIRELEGGEIVFE